ncbi:transposable element Tcb1 transposase [Trichonephila clavipes]|uniref:Transposable element Tcb1 transposase n=2 Tax=Trichonephila clavipes TaxID=2585209 RepID=A0A8X6V462_TRICX|nr:transposable element Tcb1 transposase [Trichonephila clavipes]
MSRDKFNYKKQRKRSKKEHHTTVDNRRTKKVCLRNKRISWTTNRSDLSDAGVSVSSKTIRSRLADSCISVDGIGRLHIVDGALDVRKYIDTIIEPKLLPSIKDLFNNNASSIFQQDSAPLYPVSRQVIYSQFGLAIHQNDHQARRRFVEWAQNEIAVIPDFHKRILFSDEAHFWLNGYVNKQNFRIWSEANPQVYVETPLHPEKLTVWCALWAGGILLQKR